jgi:hypothetical protein
MIRKEYTRKVVIDGVVYYDAEIKTTYDCESKKMTHEEALTWAENQGLRLLTRGERCDLWDSSVPFIQSLDRSAYWTASQSFDTSIAFAFDTFRGMDGCLHCASLCSVRAIKITQ